MLLKKLFRKPDALRLIEQAMDNAGAQAANSSNALVGTWVRLASGTSAGIAVSLLKQEGMRALSSGMTERGAERLLSVITAMMLESFMGNADNLAVVRSFGFERDEGFERDVLDCFDGYGSTFLRVTRARAAASGNEGTSWSFGFHQHVLIAVQSPNEDMAFGSAREAISAGHELGSDFSAPLSAFLMLTRTYADQFVPQLSALLRQRAAPAREGVTPPRAEEVWLPFEECCTQASHRLFSAIERSLRDGTWQAGLARRIEDDNAVAARGWSIYLEFLTIGYLACDAYAFRAFGAVARDPLMDEVARILFANFKKLSNPRGPDEAIGDMHTKMFEGVLAQYEEYGRMLSATGWSAIVDDFVAEVCRVADVVPEADMRREVRASVQPIIDMSQPG